MKVRSQGKRDVHTVVHEVTHKLLIEDLEADLVGIHSTAEMHIVVHIAAEVQARCSGDIHEFEGGFGSAL